MTKSSNTTHLYGRFAITFVSAETCLPNSCHVSRTSTSVLPHSWSTTSAWRRSDAVRPSNGKKTGSGGPGQPETLSLLQTHTGTSASSAGMALATQGTQRQKQGKPRVVPRPSAGLEGEGGSAECMCELCLHSTAKPAHPS